MSCLLHGGFDVVFYRVMNKSCKIRPRINILGGGNNFLNYIMSLRQDRGRKPEVNPFIFECKGQGASLNCIYIVVLHMWNRNSVSKRCGS